MEGSNVESGAEFSGISLDSVNLGGRTIASIDLFNEDELFSTEFLGIDMLGFTNPFTDAFVAPFFEAFGLDPASSELQGIDFTGISLAEPAPESDLTAEEALLIAEANGFSPGDPTFDLIVSQINSSDASADNSLLSSSTSQDNPLTGAASAANLLSSIPFLGGLGDLGGLGSGGLF